MTAFEAVILQLTFVVRYSILSSDFVFFTFHYSYFISSWGHHMLTAASIVLGLGLGVNVYAVRRLNM